MGWFPPTHPYVNGYASGMFLFCLCTTFRAIMFRVVTDITISWSLGWQYRPVLSPSILDVYIAEPVSCNNNYFCSRELRPSPNKKPPQPNMASRVLVKSQQRDAPLPIFLGKTAPGIWYADLNDLVSILLYWKKWLMENICLRIDI